MKKINFSIVTILAVALMFVFASCTKDGVYKPKKKISKIYETVQTDPNPEKILKEIWTWDGKLLSKISYDDGDIVTFTYEKKQLTTINNGDTRIEINYDSKGKFIDNAKMYYKDVMYTTYTFQHDKNLISSYTVEYNGPGLADNARSARIIENMFRFVAPEVAQNEVANFVKTAENNTKADNSYTVYFVYDGKNVSEQTVKSGNSQVVYTYTYTDYKNLFYGLLTDMGIDMLSKNAPSTILRTEAGKPDYNYTYTYQADGKIPTQVTENMTWTLSLGNTTTTHTETKVTDYEYTK